MKKLFLAIFIFQLAHATDIESILEQGEKTFENGHYKEVLLLFEKTPPNFDLEENAKFHLLKGRAYYRLGKNVRAMDELNRALALGVDKDSLSEIYLSQANISYVWRDYDNAIGDATRAILAGKANANGDAYALRARIKVEHGEYEAALYDLSKVLENNTDPTFSLYRGIIRLNVKDYRGAIKDIGRAYFRGVSPRDFNLAHLIVPFKENELLSKLKNNRERDLYAMIRNFALGRLERAERGFHRVLKQRLAGAIASDTELDPLFSLIKAHLLIARKKHPAKKGLCKKLIGKLLKI